ncbi:MAG: porin family protein [Epsilonproteobacteria bacterium]|nr:porin family protein [Campylobacterota bacterium]
MKNIKISIIALVALGSLGHAGGDLTPVTSYETEDIVMATEAFEEAVVVPAVEEPVYVAPTPEPKVVVPVVPIPVTETTEVSSSSSSNGFYAGLGITGVAYESNCDCKIGAGSEENIALLGRLGYDFNRYIGLEARGMKTVANGEGAEVEHVGLFIKPMLPVTNAANFYALLGAAKTTTTGNLQNVDAETLAVGAGFEYDLSSLDDGQGDEERGIGLFVDYERLVMKEDAPDLDTVSAGVTYDF